MMQASQGPIGLDRFDSRGRFLLAGLVTLMLTVSGALTGCRRSDPVAGTGTGRPVVLTTFTVLADLARSVSGDRLEIRSIVKPGAEIHGYEPTPSDLVGAADADLIIENGFGLELWSKRFTAAAGDVPVVTLSDGMQPLFIEEDAYAGKPNPHVWMSPKRTMAYVDRLVEVFSTLDPDGASTFQERGEAYKRQLDQLNNELQNALASIPETQRLLVSCEGAFSYLASDFGLKEAYLWPVNAESEVTPKRMAALITLVKQRGVPAVFCESTVNDKAQREVAAAAGARFGGTFYVDSLSSADGPAPTLLELMRHNVGLIRRELTQGRR